MPIPPIIKNNIMILIQLPKQPLNICIRLLKVSYLFSGYNIIIEESAYIYLFLNCVQKLRLTCDDNQNVLMDKNPLKMRGYR